MKSNFCKSLLTALMLLAMLAINLAPFAALAVDVQKLPENTAAATGFTHAARVTWDDLNATDNASTVLQLWPIGTNTYITKAAWFMETGMTNSTTSATNLLLCLGVGGSTNAFFTTNQLDASSTMVASGLTLWGLNTNMLVPYRGTTTTNYLIATFSAGASVVDSYAVGTVLIFWKAVELPKIKF